jgi:organic hydroperoxide reductase OsmC/OhrA
MKEVHSTYPVTVRWEGERRGFASSPDGLPALRVAPPPAFGGPAGEWTPEHLFVLSAASCWMTTFLAVSRASSLEIADIECPGEGILEKDEDRRLQISRIELRPRVTILRETDRERAERLIAKAEGFCLIRNSMRSDIVLAPEVSVEPPVFSGIGA